MSKYVRCCVFPSQHVFCAVITNLPFFSSTEPRLTCAMNTQFTRVDDVHFGTLRCYCYRVQTRRVEPSRLVAAVDVSVSCFRDRTSETVRTPLEDSSPYISTSEICRSCDTHVGKTQDQERKRVQKEMAKIRQSFGKSDPVLFEALSMESFSNHNILFPSLKTIPLRHRKETRRWIQQEEVSMENHVSLREQSTFCLLSALEANSKSTHM